MAVANLKETLLTYTLRANQINLEITQKQNQKALAAYSQGDVTNLKLAETNELRNYYKNLLEGDKDLQEQYTDYTEIPDFEDEMNRLTAKYQEQFDELAAWESILNSQITTLSAELEETNTFRDSFKTMLTSNIQEDCDFSMK